ncbi:MAG: YhdH/YhfP family quinone oxidoreductase [Planctomycetaceae bacterium]|nr:YhdH/YhfP family quinone oxidoreductase [Planctomycetaceae bacterium]
MSDDRFQACLVTAETPGRYGGEIVSLDRSQLPPGDVLIRVEYSSANYKDALAAGGHRGIVRTLPHVPGIDAAGTVVDSAAPEVVVGAQVLVTGYELGSGRWGGWAEYIRVPAEWVVPLHQGLSPREAMILGTAGFTAAQCVEALQRHDIEPSSGPIVVTGATGGVGSLAVMLLSRLGYHVTGVTGKTERHDWLQSLGAKAVLSRQAVDDQTSRPLLSARWAGAVDTVGGGTLSTLIRALKHRGCVAACGLVGGTDLSLTVYPFLLRGVKLDGIDSAQCPREKRIDLWRKLSGEWRLEGLDRVAREFELSQVASVVEDLLAGRSVGRPVLRIGQNASSAVVTRPQP